VSERQPLPYSWPDVKDRLQREFPRVLGALGIHDRERGGMVTPLNPTRVDRRPGSFVIWTTQGRDGAVGAWKDYATGEAGDVFELIAYLLRLQAKMDAYWWALDFLGLQRGGVVRTKAEADQDRERFARENAAAKARADKEAAAKSMKLKMHWLALPKWPGTLVEPYLGRARKIPLDRLPHLPEALRFEPEAEHFDRETGELTKWPAICTAVTRGSEITGLHRTYLAPDGIGKGKGLAPVARAKLMFGSCRGGAIRLSPGGSGLSPTQAAKRGRLDPLILGEGIETTLTACVAQPTYRAWSTMSLGFMRQFEWPECANALVLLKENDLPAEAVAEFGRVEAYWLDQARGRPVKAAASEVGSDFNDWAMA
jgi:hypothetical protein